MLSTASECLIMYVPQVSIAVLSDANQNTPHSKCKSCLTSVLTSLNFGQIHVRASSLLRLIPFFQGYRPSCHHLGCARALKLALSKPQVDCHA
jgi:hypothetical protein